MRTRRQARGLVGVAALALTVAACGNTSSTDNAGSSDSAEGGTVTVAHADPENNFLPSNTTETVGGQVVDALFTGLVVYSPDNGDAQNAMAESITPSDNNKKYTVKLKTGWKFHDGTEVKAKNFVDAWNFAANGKNAQSTSYFFEPIAGFADVQGEDTNGDGKLEKQPTAETMSGLRILDDYSFEINLTASNAAFVQRLGYVAFSPLPDVFFSTPNAAATFGDKPIGNGPFKFVKWDKGSMIEVERYADYMGPDAASIDKVDFKVYADPSSSYNDLLANNVDLVEPLPTFALAGDKYKADLGDRIIKQAQGALQSISAPLYDSKYKNPKITMALSMAIDRDTIIKNVFQGTRVTADGWVPPTIKGYEPGACGEGCTYNPTRAKEVLAEAGGFQGTVTIAYNADAPTNHKAWVDAVCVSIKNALGVDCQAKSYAEFGKMQTDINGKKMTGLFRSAWVMDYPAIENFLEPQFAKNGSSNANGYDNPAYDAKLKEAQAASPEQSIALYQEAEKLLATNMPSIPLWYDTTLAGYSDRVANVKYTPFGTPDLTSITVK